MNEKLQEAFDVITTAQPKTEGPVRMVGEQLKDILRAAPQFAQIVIDDFAASKNHLVDCEKKIHNYATGHGGCCTPKAAEMIIREHFGLPAEGEAPAAPAAQGGGVTFDLDSFL